MKKIKAGDLVWHVSSSTGSLRPAILVRHAPGRGNKSVINVFENGKNEFEEKVPYNEVAIWTMEPSSIVFEDKKILVAANAAVKKSGKKSMMNVIVKLKKCRVSNEGEGAETSEDFYDPTVQSKIDKSKKDFLNSLDSDEDEGSDADNDKENSGENENENSGEFTKKWKPVVGKNRKPLAPVVAQKKEKLSEIELIRQRNIAQRNEMLKKMKAAAMAAKGPQKVKRPQKVKKSRSYKHNPDIRRKQPKREYGTRSKAPKIENVSHFHSLPLCFVNIITYSRRPWTRTTSALMRKIGSQSEGLEIQMRISLCQKM